MKNLKKIMVVLFASPFSIDDFWDTDIIEFSQIDQNTYTWHI